VHENEEMTAAIYHLTRGTSRWGHAARLLIESDRGLTRVFAPSGYLYSPPSFSPQSPVMCLVSAVTDTFPLDSKSSSQTS
jgi:hypothetical protein